MERGRANSDLSEKVDETNECGVYMDVCLRDFMDLFEQHFNVLYSSYTVYNYVLDEKKALLYAF